MSGRRRIQPATGFALVLPGSHTRVERCGAKTAALGFSLALNHPFLDGNKRVAHAAMDAFLMLCAESARMAGVDVLPLFGYAVNEQTGCAVPVAGSAPRSCAVRLQDHCDRPSKGRRDASEPLRLAADPDQGGGGGDTSGRGSGTNPSRFGIRTSSKLRRSSTCVSGTISLRNRTYATTA